MSFSVTSDTVGSETVTSDIELAVELAAEYESLSFEVEEEVEMDKYGIFEELYAGFSCEDARVVSRMEREAKKYTSSSLTYGEITLPALQYIMERLYENEFPLSGGSFLDIGAGSGRPV